MHIITDKIEFPHLDSATQDGLLAIGGDLSVERLLLAYKIGVFPWFEIDQPLLWWAPDPRFVLYPEDLKVSKSMRQLFRKHTFRVSYNQAFEKVIQKCAIISRKDQEGTWITQHMIEAYCRLHELGFAKSVEVWKDDQLVGGLYGVDLNNGVFCGESMFAQVSNASKYGFISFVQQSKYKLIDCQMRTKHLESLGGKHISRARFVKLLNSENS
ncbi:MAG: leucyl/phenylalanyl-tRNA--protein transferase [Flavobacteriaceae bacterium]|nr:leucyl/phenylalanyl-tRNA--protein transferase [Flavobacteriaceae bacterium]